jgi:hypothetical protein
MYNLSNDVAGKWECTGEVSSPSSAWVMDFVSEDDSACGSREDKMIGPIWRDDVRACSFMVKKRVRKL